MTYKFGDRVTFKTENQILVTDKKTFDKDIIKRIERIGSNGWETIWKENKNLLTEEEKEFLRQALKFGNYGSTTGNGTIKFICKSGYYIYMYYDEWASNTIYIDKNLYFKSLEEDKKYILKELGLEGT